MNVYSLHKADRDRDPSVLGIPRSKEETLHHMAMMSQCRTAKEVANLKTKYGTRPTINSLLELPLDLHRYALLQSV